MVRRRAVTPTRSRWLTGLGVLLVLAGLAVLGYFGWQYFGTNWVSQRRHAAVIEQLDRAWQDGRTRVSVDEGSAAAVVRIPRFGGDYAVPVLEGTSDDVLAAGFGHFAGSADVGEPGNYALAGHRVTHGEPLRDLPDLEVGDEIVVETADTTYTYELVTAGDALTVPFTASWVLDPVPVDPDGGGVQPPQRRGERLLTLTTCAELFHTDDRLVAFAVLAGERPRAG